MVSTPIGVFATDEMAIGLADALEAAKIPPGQIPVGVVDELPDGLDAMHRKRLDVTIDQDAMLEGGRAVDDALKPIPHQPVQQYDGIAFDLVTDRTLPRYMVNWACGPCGTEPPKVISAVLPQ